MTEQLTFTIGTATAERLKKMADDEGRSLSNLICRLLEAAVKDDRKGEEGLSK